MFPPVSMPPPLKSYYMLKVFGECRYGQNDLKDIIISDEEESDEQIHEL